MNQGEDRVPSSWWDREYRPLGPVRLRNVSAPVTLLEVVGAHPSDEDVAVDPVCRMRVSLAEAPARLPFDGRTWFFCSFPCARLFAARPEDYAGGTAP